jgi:Ca2+-binding RTX toxin-like protein
MPAVQISRLRADKSKVFLFAMVLLFSTTLPLLGTAVADHGDSGLDVEPETDINTVGDTHTLTATLQTGDPTPTPVPAEQTATATFAFESGPSQGSENLTCDIDIGETTCDVTYTSEQPGTDSIRSWIEGHSIDEIEVLGDEDLDTTDVVEKTWEVGPATDISLAPADATNTVGDPHTATATVTDEFGNPVEGQAVHFDVAGDGAPVPDSGDDDSDAEGEAPFGFTNDTPGSNTITACIDENDNQTCDEGEPSATATKTWEVGPATDISLAPADATNRPGDPHTVTATVTDDFDNPVEGQAVHFDVAGGGVPLPDSGDDDSDADGEAEFGFTNQSESANTITACIDENDNQTCDDGEPSADATKMWALPQCLGESEGPRSGGGEVIIGTTGDDILMGTPGDDLICALGGDDIVTAGGGDDVVTGGAGADFIAGGRGSDLLLGGGGGDDIAGGRGNDEISGGRGNDDVSGGDGRDRLSGGDGRDRLSGGAGPDRLAGGGGRDRIVGGAGRDRLSGGAGPDRLAGGGGRDRIAGGAGRDRINGGAGRDRASGGAGRDKIAGKGGNDVLKGNSGPDRILGGAGSDTIRGGPGNDTCRGGPGNDTITGCEN